MKMTITLADFRNEFKTMGRSGQFTYDGITALFDGLTDYEEATGEEWELDIIALCCEFTEYADLAEIQDVYPDIEDMNDLEANTLVILTDSSIIIMDY